jgi:hypothetical protein
MQKGVATSVYCTSIIVMGSIQGHDEMKPVPLVDSKILQQEIQISTLWQLIACSLANPTTPPNQT